MTLYTGGGAIPSGSSLATRSLQEQADERGEKRRGGEKMGFCTVCGVSIERGPLLAFLSLGDTAPFDTDTQQPTAILSLERSQQLRAQLGRHFFHSRTQPFVATRFDALGQRCGSDRSSLRRHIGSELGLMVCEPVHHFSVIVPRLRLAATGIKPGAQISHRFTTMS